MKNNKSFTKHEVPEDDVSLEEVEDVLQGMIDKGLVVIVGVDEEGNNLYQLTEMGRQISTYIDSDKTYQN